MSSKVSTLTVSLKDDVSGKAGQIGKALKSASDQAKAMAKALDGTGASRGFVNNLSKLGLSAKDIDRVAASMKDYAKAAGIAGNASSWTKQQTAQIRAWESATVASLRHVAAEQKALAANTRDMVAGMSRAGRDMIDRARVAAGMSAPARAAAAARIKEQVKAEAELRERLEAQAAARSDARRTLAGMAGLYVGHKVKEGTRAVGHTYREFDKERRFGKAVMGLTDEEQRPLVDQAIHMGATTKYNDVQVLESQRELAARGLKRDQVLGLMDPASKLGMSLDLTLPAAVKQMEGALFGFKKPMATLEEALASAKQTADLQVKAAKISGMTPEDLTQAYKYAATPARMGGLSEETMLAFAGISKKANMGGDEAGVAFRALVANILSPTRKAKEAMLANGMDPKNYQRNPDRIDTEAFAKTVAAQYGVKLDKGTKGGLDKIFSNKAMIADPAKFTPAVMKLLSDNLGGDDAKSKKSIAGLANRFRDASMRGVDSNAMTADLMGLIQKNPALANAIFGSKQGGRIANALQDPEYFKKVVDELKNHSEGYSDKVSAERMAGFDGATSRFEGAVKNLETAMGRAFDDDGKGGFLTGLVDRTAKVTQALAEMPRPALQAAGALAWLGGKASSAVGTAALVGAAFSLKGSAAALTAAAGRLGLGGVAGAASGGLGAGLGSLAVATLAVGSIAVAGAITAALLIDGAQSGKALVHGGKPDFGMNPSDELPGLPGSSDAPSWARNNARAIPSMIGRDLRQSPGGAGSGLSGFGLSGPQAAAPRGDDSGLKQLHASAEELQAVLQQLSGISVSPQANSGALDGLIASAQQALNLLRQIPGAASAAGAAAVEGIRARGSSGAYQGPDYAGP